jgi:DNA-binding transcriptional regulator YiaG
MTDEKTGGRVLITHERRILHLGGSKLRYLEFNNNIEPLVEVAGGMTMVRSASISAFLLNNGAIATQHLRGTMAEVSQNWASGEPSLRRLSYLAQVDAFFRSEGAMLFSIVDKAYEKSMALRDDELIAGPKTLLGTDSDLLKACLQMRGEGKFLELGQFLRKRRQEAGLTVATVAYRLGASVSTIHRWETTGKFLRDHQLSRYLRATETGSEEG